MDAYKRFALKELTVAQLQARRSALVSDAPGIGALVPGVLVEQHRQCGRGGCRCARGVPHGPYVYLQATGRSVYVPALLADDVRARVAASVVLRDVLHQIGAINLELLTRREVG